jgi:uncharacterized membrane protein
LKDHNCYLTEHKWEETIWDTNTIGFVTNIDPSFYNPTQAHTKFLQMMEQKKNAINETRIRIKIPPFKMVFSSPTTYLPSNTRTSTKAYSIEVKQADQTQMMQVLKSIFSDNLSVFVPHSMKYKYPESYEKAIKYQTWQITNNSMIVLQNISESAMYYIETHIKAIKGVKDLLPAKDVEYTGRHNILADKNEFQQIRNQLITSLPVWYDNQVPSDALPNDGKYPGPPRVKPILRDSESSGENSWVSRSSASFMSMDLSMVEHDDYFSSSNMASNVFTYAAVASNQPTTNQVGPTSLNSDIDENKEVISDITGAGTENIIQKHKQEIEQLMERQKQEREDAETIMAAQKVEIQRMKEAYQRANAAYEEVTAELRTQRAQVTKMITEKLSIADKKRNEDMKAMRHEMMMAMKDMLLNTQNDKQADTRISNFQTKRPQQTDETTVDDEDQQQEHRREKRANRMKTPTKKLIFDEEHLSEELMTQFDSSLSTRESDEGSFITEEQ